MMRLKEKIAFKKILPFFQVCQSRRKAKKKHWHEATEQRRQNAHSQPILSENTRKTQRILQLKRNLRCKTFLQG